MNVVVVVKNFLFFFQNMTYNIKKIFDEKFCTMQRASNKIEKKKKKIYMISRLIIYVNYLKT